MEVPQLYIDRYGHYVLIFSTRVKSDFCGGTHKAGGFQELTSMKCINTITEPPDFNRSQPNVLMPESSGLYACRVIHELDGEIVGFDIKQGGIRRSGIKTYLKPVNRNFTDVDFQV
jgi:beta-fructofuranosidase